MVRKSSASRAGSLIGVGKSRGRPLGRKTRRGGRPTRKKAMELRDRILEVATELFLSEGYGTTSIEAVAARAGISKRTFYHRFDNKATLFVAVVHRIIEQIRPPPEVALLEGASLQQILRRFAKLMLRAALTSEAIALHRLVMAESLRFPNLVRSIYAEGWGQAADLIADLLARQLPNSGLTSDLRGFAALQFLHMVVTVPQRRGMGLGSPMTPKELDLWADTAVDLFLSGCQGLSPESPSKGRLARIPTMGRQQ